MSFELLLEVDALTEVQAHRVQDRCEREGAWPVQHVARSGRFPWSKPRGPSLFVPESHDGHDLLSDDATWDAPFWSMNDAECTRLARALEILGEELDQGFAFRATWVGSGIRTTRVLTSLELAELARRSRLNEFTSYVVAERPGQGG